MTSNNLFSPFSLKDVTLKNRIAVSPMCQYSSQEGFANDWHLVHLVSRAIGGAGLVMTEATAVTPEGRISPYDLGLWSDQHIVQLNKITHMLKMHGAIAGIQLAHAGRKASTKRPWDGHGKLSDEEGGWLPVSPTSIPFTPNDIAPKELTLENITNIKTAFALAAKRASLAGFKILEIHAAHGYLIHEFLSPLVNSRIDHYGGSFENRIRFLLEIITEVKKVWPEHYPLFLRISATDWMQDGWQLEESISLARLLKKEGVDLIDTSSGGIVLDAKIPYGPGYQTLFATRIRQETDIATGAVGGITSPHQADHIIRTGQADIVLLGREMLRNPYWSLMAAKELGHAITWPSQYLRATN